MSDYDVYDNEMLKQKFSDQEVERIVTGDKPQDEMLAHLGSVLEALHRHDFGEPSEETVALFAAEAAEIARSMKPEHPAVDAAPSRRPGRYVVAVGRKIAAVALAMFVFVGMTGVAIASDDAAPGDPLYGLDRALESIGVNNGGPGERISEAQSLANDGQVTKAITHVAEAVEESDDDPEDGFSPEPSNAAAALRDAASDVGNDNNNPNSQQVRTALAAMLTEMADMIGDPEFDGATFGERVAEMARSIGGNEDDAPAPNDDEDLQPGPPEDAGPPDETPGGGAPDDTTRSGPPDDTPGSGPPNDVPNGPPGGNPGRP